MVLRFFPQCPNNHGGFLDPSRIHLDLSVEWSVTFRRQLEFQLPGSKAGIVDIINSRYFPDACWN